MKINSSQDCILQSSLLFTSDSFLEQQRQERKYIKMFKQNVNYLITVIWLNFSSIEEVLIKVLYIMMYTSFSQKYLKLCHHKHGIETFFIKNAVLGEGLFFSL